MTPVRMLFIGQKPLGEAAWDRVRAAENDQLRVVAVCSNADPSSVWWKSNRIYETAQAQGLTFIDNATRDASALLAAIEALAINFILIVQYPWVLPPEVIRGVDGRVLSFHSAKLPAYRGHNSFSHALLNRDPTYTITATWVADQLDSGDLAFESEFPIERDDTALSLYAKGYHVALAMLDTVLDRLRTGEPLPRRPQSGDARFYGIADLDRHREIRSADPGELELKSRAFYFPPYEPAYITVGQERVYVVPSHARRDIAATSGAAMADALVRYESAAATAVK